MVGDETRLVRILIGTQAHAAKLRALVPVPVCDTVEVQLVLEQVAEQPGKAPGGQRLPAGIIDPGPVMRVEPAVLLLVGIGPVHFVGVPDIHDRQGTPLGICPAIQEQRLVGPLGERVRIDQALRPGGLEARDQGGRLLE
jgi:hypothetical protein